MQADGDEGQKGKKDDQGDVDPVHARHGSVSGKVPTPFGTRSVPLE
jgi:hypothetical protein